MTIVQELKAIRKRHWPDHQRFIDYGSTGSRPFYCKFCHQKWPCDATRAINACEILLAESLDD